MLAWTSLNLFKDNHFCLVFKIILPFFLLFSLFYVFQYIFRLHEGLIKGKLLILHGCSAVRVFIHQQHDHLILPVHVNTASQHRQEQRGH